MMERQTAHLRPERLCAQTARLQQVGGRPEGLRPVLWALVDQFRVALFDPTDHHEKGSTYDNAKFAEVVHWLNSIIERMFNVGKLKGLHVIGMFLRFRYARQIARHNPVVVGSRTMVNGSPPPLSD